MRHINKRKQFLDLIKKYLNGEVSEDQLNFIKKYYGTFEKEEDVLNTLSEKERKLIEEKIESSIMEKLNTETVKPVYVLWKPISAAAAIILIALSIGLYFNFSANDDQKLSENSQVSPDIAPGGNKAILTLTDGSTISLNDIKNGEIAKQAGATITKTKDGQLIYSVISDNREQSISSQFNTISTPKGGYYQIILPDGTKVWLNAASSLTYPTVFTSKERKVELTGEAYFEVSQLSAGGSKVPFLVSTSSQIVEVLGTHFNINAYSDEPLAKTTLLEGSVRIALHNKEKRIILKPSEQATVTADREISVSVVNTSNVVAWKSGLFQFENSDIKSVMRELSRWYDVDVEFEGEIPDIKLWGKIHRNVNASEALKILSYFDLKYRIIQSGKNKKIIIS